MRCGPEARLVSALLAEGLINRVFCKSGPATVLLEPELSSGIPDMVIVAKSRRTARAIPAHLTENHFRVLHHLFQQSKSSIDELHAYLRFDHPVLLRILRDLSQAGLVNIRSGVIWIGPRQNIFGASSIVSIEAKMNSWRKALRQALANKWFASSSYILIPETRALRDIRQACKSFGVGIIVQRKNVMRVALYAKHHRIPVSPGSWRILQLASNPN